MKWVRLEVEAARLGLRPGTKINGLALTQENPQPYLAKLPPGPPTAEPPTEKEK